MKFFGEGRWGFTQDKGGLLVSGQGAPIWLAGVIVIGSDPVRHEILVFSRGCRALQNGVDFRVQFSSIFFFVGFGIHTASIPSTTETHTGGGAVLGKPEGSPARRYSHNIVLK